MWHRKDDELADDSRDVPVGYVSIGPPSLASSSRHEAFGKHFQPDVVNKWFATVTRVVLDPRYRGAGIASTMLRESCRAHARREGTKYLEAKTSMGAVNRFNQSAGFRLIGTNSQLEQGEGAGGGRIGHDREGDTTPDGTRNKNQRIRKVYEFIMDTEAELGVDLDYTSSDKRRRRRSSRRGGRDG
ncbi:MAG: GNAT family N-acetyltransferase [Halobacteria archaeon]|nr:GNAT family N-acetyltransferase [Halobacteria archaeon]